MASNTTFTEDDYDAFKAGVNGPASSVDARIAVFDGTTGKLIKDGLKTIATVLSDALAAALAAIIPVDLASEVTGDLPYANVTPASAASRVLVRGSASGAGDWQEGTLGTGLAMTGTVLSASAGSGDVVGPGSATDGHLAVFDGTTGKLIKDGGAPGGGGGDLVLIETKTPSATGTITFSSLGSYTHLRIIYTARSDAALTNDLLSLTLNADGGANYDRERLSANGTTVGATEVVAGTAADIAAIAAASAAAGLAGSGDILFVDYRGTTFHKGGTSTITTKNANTTTNIVLRIYGWWWRNTAAITSITLTLTGGNFVAGSKFSLYGLN